MSTRPSVDLDLEQVAGAEVAEAPDRAEAGAVDPLDHEAFEVGVIELVGSGRGQGRARHEQLAARERLGRIAVVDPLRFDQDAGARLADDLQLEEAATLPVMDGPVGRDVGRPLGEAAQPEGALQAVRGRDLGHADPRRCPSPIDHERWFRTTLAAPGGQALAAAAASAFLASSSFAFLPVPRCLTVSDVMPAPSRKRATRSLALAPLASQ